MITSATPIAGTFGNLATENAADATLQGLAVAACGQLVTVDMLLEPKGGDPFEVVRVARQGVEILAGLEKRGPLPPELFRAADMLKATPGLAR